MDLLKRQLAPVTDEAWIEIDTKAAQVIKTNLSARTVVDFVGPHGWMLGAVNLGRLRLVAEHTSEGIPWGVREMLPLIEVRIPFTLSQMELDNVSRGSRDADVHAMEAAAQKIATFEDRAIYLGFNEGQIKGMVQMSSHAPLELKASNECIQEVAGEAVKALKMKGVGGPYALALGSKPYYTLFESCRVGYPPSRILRELIEGGPILWSPALEGGVVVTTRGGDFELTVGQDISIGYASHDRQNVELYLTESFTFRVLEPDAAIELKLVP